jgi:pimeloyl-ACP methyl ester carboxylesterase
VHEVRLLEWGDPRNEKVLICVHGLSRNAHDFDFLAMALEKDYRVICPDMAGRGDSPNLKQKEWYDYETYVGDMLYIMDQYGLDTVDWVGTSMGGIIGMVIAAQFPKRIKTLVLNDIGPFIPKESLERIAAYVGYNNFPTLAAAKEALTAIYKPLGVKDEHHLEHLARFGIKQEVGEFRFAYDPAIVHALKNEDGSMKELDDVDLWPLWDKLKCPVRLLRGKNSDVLLEHTVEAMKEIGDRLKVITCPDVGHAPSLMEKQQIEVIKGWLS